MKRVLILTADFGYGHRSAANAIAEALQGKYGDACSVEIVNPLDDPNAPTFLREDQGNYDKLVRELPDLYRLGYQVSETRVAGSLLKTTWTLMLFNVLRDVVRQKQPDVIVCTYLFYQGILDAIFIVERQRIPLVTVVTDLVSVNRLWFHPAADLCLVPTQTVYDLATDAGLPPEKVKVTGIPVRQELAQAVLDQASLRTELGWRQDLFTVFAIGSKRVVRLYDSLRVLNHSGLPLQLVIAAGGDPDLFQRFQETEWHVETHLYDFVSEMATFMKAADCVISKAGGLIVSESLACGLPMVLVDVIPGQETGNAEYVVAGGAGDLAQEPIEVLEALCHWLADDRRLYRLRAQNARQLGRPHAAVTVAELAWSAEPSRDQPAILEQLKNVLRKPND